MLNQQIYNLCFPSCWYMHMIDQILEKCSNPSKHRWYTCVMSINKMQVDPENITKQTRFCFLFMHNDLFICNVSGQKNYPLYNHIARTQRKMNIQKKFAWTNKYYWGTFWELQSCYLTYEKFVLRLVYGQASVYSHKVWNRHWNNAFKVCYKITKIK